MDGHPSSQRALSGGSEIVTIDPLMDGALRSPEVLEGGTPGSEKGLSHS